jgi:acetyl esterase/lipase
MRLRIFLILMISYVFGDAQEKIPLYQGKAPGSEMWNWEEKELLVGGMRLVFDVVQPELIAYVPAKPNGTAVIIAPGGAFHALAIDHEGTDVAKWLNAKGVTAFVLKYRLSHDDPNHPENNFSTLMAKRDFRKLDSINNMIIPLALQDGLAAMRYVRAHADQYHIQPGKIGFMGFSAGATLTLSVVYSAKASDRPNFVAPVYAYENAIIGNQVPKENTPIFVAAASDDDLGFATHSVHIYLKWLEAGQPAELHMYQQGKHGFGMRKQNLPVDGWIDRFGDWLKQLGLL